MSACVPLPSADNTIAPQEEEDGFSATCGGHYLSVAQSFCLHSVHKIPVTEEQLTATIFTSR